MSSVAQIGQQRRIRVLNGPLEGRAFSLRHCLEIGRSFHADIQLLGDGVSRRHARILRNANGRDQVEDLYSTNGTVIEGLRIRRQQLAPQMIFTVGKTHFIYENLAAEESDLETARDHTSSHNDPRSRRSTIAYPYRELHLVDGAASTHDPDPDAPVARQTISGLEPTRSLDASDLRLLVESKKASFYSGELVGDILDYRWLRSLMVGGTLLGRERLTRLHALEACLRCTPNDKGTHSGPELRLYRRYSCRLTGEICLDNDNAHPVVLVELGADGARIHAPKHRLTAGMQVHLTLETTSDGQITTAQFPSRIAWTQHSHAGLQFHHAAAQRPRSQDLAPPESAHQPTSRWPRAL